MLLGALALPIVFLAGCGRGREDLHFSDTNFTVILTEEASRHATETDRQFSVNDFLDTGVALNNLWATIESTPDRIVLRVTLVHQGRENVLNAISLFKQRNDVLYAHVILENNNSIA